MKKKVISMLLAATMLSSLVACGGTTDSSSAGGDEEVWTCTVPFPAITEDTSDDSLADVEAAVNEITVPEIGVEVKLEPIYCFNMNSAQTLDISSGGDLDLVLCMLETNASYIKNGSIMEITDLYDKYGSDITASLGEAVNAGSLDGKIYTIPVGGVLGHSYGLLIRSDMLEKAGYSAEDQSMSIDELTDLFAAVKEQGGDGFYPIAGLVDPSTLIKFDDLGVSPSSGVILLDEDTDTVVNYYASDEYKEVADTIYEWAQAGYINPDAGENDAASDLIAANSAAGMFSNTNPGQSDWLANNCGYDITAIEIVDSYSKNTDLSNVSWGIASTCDNPEKAMQLINLMFADNDFSKIMFSGIEGTDYEVVETDDEGNQVITFPEGKDMMTVSYYNMFGVWPNPKTQWAPSDINYFKEVEEYNANMVYSPAFGYTFDTTDYASSITAIDAVVAEYKSQVWGGKGDPDEVIPSFVKALEDAGINDVIAANQKSYDSWKKNQ